MEKLKENWKRIIEEKEGYFITKIYKEVYKEDAERCIHEVIEILIAKNINLDGYGFLYVEDPQTHEFIVQVIPKPGEQAYRYKTSAKELIEVD
jgi:hypothetical protein